jgi:hypothetical protein
MTKQSMIDINNRQQINHKAQRVMIAIVEAGVFCRPCRGFKFFGGSYPRFQRGLIFGRHFVTGTRWAHGT